MAALGGAAADEHSVSIEYTAVLHHSDSVGQLDLTPPWSDSWSNNIAMCAIMRQENETDVVEWLQYYRWLGFDHIYLFENDPDGVTKPMQHALQTYIDSSFVTLQELDDSNGQLLVYNKCIKEYTRYHNWLAFFDLDEFLVLRERGANLKTFLNEFKESPGIVINWIIFGSSGRLQRPVEGGVLAHYLRCNPRPDNRVKLIANTFYVTEASNPHNAHFRSWGHAVDENHVPIPHETRLVQAKWGSEECRGQRTQCAPRGGHHTVGTSVQRVALFHYMLRSREDYKTKSARSRGLHKTARTEAFFRRMDGRSNSTAPICREAAQLVNKCCGTRPR